MLFILIAVCTFEMSHSAATTHAQLHVTPKPTPEHSLVHGLYFKYDTNVLENLLIAIILQTNDCYCMPLSDQDILDIQTPDQLDKMEEFMLTQIVDKAYKTWSRDDLSVRSGYWGSRCKGHIYRVYRVN